MAKGLEKKVKILACETCGKITEHKYDGRFALDINLKFLPKELRNKEIYTCKICGSSQAYERKEKYK